MGLRGPVLQETQAFFHVCSTTQLRDFHFCDDSDWLLSRAFVFCYRCRLSLTSVVQECRQNDRMRKARGPEKSPSIRTMKKLVNFFKTNIIKALEIKQWLLVSQGHFVQENGCIPMNGELWHSGWL